MGIIDNALARLGYYKASRKARNPAMAAIAEHGAMNMPDYAIYTNQARAYEVFSWVSFCVDRISQAVALVPLNVSQQIGEDEEEIKNHPFELLLRRPNPVHTRSELLRNTSAFMRLCGNAYWYLALNGAGELAEIWSMRPDRVRPIPDPVEFVRGYTYEVDGHTIPLEKREVVHFRAFHPLDDYMGMSAIESLAYQLEGDRGMVRWNANFFSKDNAVPASIVQLPMEMQDDDFDDFVDNFVRQHGGTNRKTAFIRASESEINWKTIVPSQTDMQFLEGRRWTREEIFLRLGVPLGKWSENATEANAKVANDTFINDTVWPELVYICEQITATVIIPFYGEGLVVRPKDIRPTNKDQWLQELGIVTNGTVTPGGTREPLMGRDEIRQHFWQLTPFAETEINQADIEREEAEAEEREARAEAMRQSMQQGQQNREEGNEDNAEELEERERGQWQRKAMSALKRGKSANVDFDAVVIGPEDRLAIRGALATAQTAEEVKAVFAAPFHGRFDWQGYP